MRSADFVLLVYLLGKSDEANCEQSYSSDTLENVIV